MKLMKYVFFFSGNPFGTIKLCILLFHSNIIRFILKNNDTVNGQYQK